MFITNMLNIFLYFLFLFFTGALYDATEDYNACFYFAGSLILVSAFLCYPLPYVARWENKRNEKNALPHA